MLKIIKHLHESHAWFWPVSLIVLTVWVVFGERFGFLGLIVGAAVLAATYKSK